jgi:hypothetical protein
MLTLQEYVLPLSSVAIPNSSSVSERVVSITAPWAEQMRMAFLGRADFMVIVNLNTRVPVVGVTGDKDRRNHRHGETQSPEPPLAVSVLA